jgi:hypothetical protein
LVSGCTIEVWRYFAGITDPAALQQIADGRGVELRFCFGHPAVEATGNSLDDVLNDQSAEIHGSVADGMTTELIGRLTPLLIGGLTALPRVLGRLSAFLI